MKRFILFLIAFLFIVGTINLSAGIAHMVCVEIFEADGTYPTGEVTFEAVNLSQNPSEILTEESLGCSWNDYMENFVAVQVGNFDTPWEDADILQIEATSVATGDSNIGEYTLIMGPPIQVFEDDAGITLPVELLNPLSATCMENGSTMLTWTTASESDVEGFNVYRADEDVFENSAQLNASIIPGQGTTTEPEDYEFEDLDQLEFNTTYYYWLESVDFSGTSEVFDAVEYTPAEDPGSSNEEFDTNKLTVSNNPIVGNNVTIIYAIAGKQVNTPVEISIYSTKGQLVDNVTATGGETSISTSGFSSGVYFYQIKTESFNQIKKMVVVK